MLLPHLVLLITAVLVGTSICHPGTAPVARAGLLSLVLMVAGLGIAHRVTPRQPMPFDRHRCRHNPLFDGPPARSGTHAVGYGEATSHGSRTAPRAAVTP